MNNTTVMQNSFQGSVRQLDLKYTPKKKVTKKALYYCHPELVSGSITLKAVY